jgi:putative membrane protein insertion efficiency factor
MRAACACPGHSGRPAISAGGRAAALSVAGTLERIPRLVGIALIKAYRAVLSPLIGRECRYLPTCSEYTEEAILRYGLWAGFWIGLARIQRCGPFGASGFDPVPAALPPHAHWFTPWRYGRWTGRHIDPKTRLDLP